jgi:hypothetical protein
MAIKQLAVSLPLQNPAKRRRLKELHWQSNDVIQQSSVEIARRADAGPCNDE